MTPAPTVRHQHRLRKLARTLEDFIESRQLGTVLVAPLDVVVQCDPLRTRQPDLLFISAEGIGIEQLIDLERLEFAADLVIEIISPAVYCEC